MSSKPCPNCHYAFTQKWGRSGPVLCKQNQSRQRYKCTRCGRSFSENTNLMSYRLKKNDRALNSKIFQSLVNGMSNRRISRLLNVSEHCVRLRIKRMSQQAFVFHHLMSVHLPIIEPLAYDGLENFAGSQYDPNNIQHAVGAESLFIYDFNFAPLNRSGRMSRWQKERLEQIEQEYGRYDPAAIRKQSVILFERLKKRAGDKLQIWSDEHFQYKRAMRQNRHLRSIKHKRISSKICRNFQNILFSVNHADLLTRQQLAAFARETISFSKTAVAMCQKYMLFAVYKNYMAPQFTKKHLRRPEAHEQSPAESLGITDHLLSFKEIFHLKANDRIAMGMNDDWRAYYLSQMTSVCVRNEKFVRSAC